MYHPRLGVRWIWRDCCKLLDFMDKHFSRYLDLMRFSAAVLVVLTHYVQRGILGSPAHPLPIFGREAVMVFFLLSGYVIAWTTSEKALSLRQYVVARSARIYSVALPVLLLCFLLVTLASHFAVIPATVAYQPLKPYIYLPLHLLFMGELWNLSETPPWLIQYWSLGYEVWYYVLFGVAYYLRGAKRLLLGALVLLIMGPKLWLLLPIWLAGAYLYKYQKPLPLTPNLARLGWLATIVLLGLYKYAGLDVYLRALGSHIWPFPGLHLGSADRYLADYAVCILIYLNFALARQADFSFLARWDRPIRALAAYTFTLYLIHGPVMGLWSLFFEHAAPGALGVAMLSAAIALATYVVGLLTEQRKAWFQDAFNALYLSCSRRFA
jgi:peptidoglycan/LPS O-acetylase OafA/YrhL